MGVFPDFRAELTTSTSLLALLTILPPSSMTWRCSLQSSRPENHRRPGDDLALERPAGGLVCRARAARGMGRKGSMVNKAILVPLRWL